MCRSAKIGACIKQIQFAKPMKLVLSIKKSKWRFINLAKGLKKHNFAFQILTKGR
jgi:hypothetical protein